MSLCCKYHFANCILKTESESSISIFSFHKVLWLSVVYPNIWNQEGPLII